MNFLLDTNVISEVTRPRPDPSVLAFLHETDEDRLYLSVVTLGELRRGVDLKADGHARTALDQWLRDDLPLRFLGRILDIDARAADDWGVLMAQAARRGVALHVMDGFLAALTRVHAMTLVTRNTKDFAPFDLRLHNPWT